MSSTEVQSVQDAPQTSDVCFFCLESKEESKNSNWLNPCLCCGSTKWVHENCLQRWIDVMQMGDSLTPVQCTQCGYQYRLRYPPFPLPMKLLIKVDQAISYVCPVLTGAFVFGSIYWIAVTFGGVTFIQVFGDADAFEILSRLHPALLFVLFPAIPISLMSLQLFHWENSVAAILERLLLPRQNPPSSSVEVAHSFTRSICYAVLMPTIASWVGEILLGNVISSSFYRTLAGGLLTMAVKSICEIYFKYQNVSRNRHRQILNGPLSDIAELPSNGLDECANEDEIVIVHLPNKLLEICSVVLGKTGTAESNLIISSCLVGACRTQQTCRVGHFDRRRKVHFQKMGEKKTVFTVVHSNNVYVEKVIRVVGIDYSIWPPMTIGELLFQEFIISEGATSVVMKGHCFGTDVAVKCMKDFAHVETMKKEVNAFSVYPAPSSSSSIVFQVKFLNDVRSHANIVTIFGACYTGIVPFAIITELADVGSVYDVVHSTDPTVFFSRGNVANWALQTAQALKYLHNLLPSPIIHGDVKTPKYSEQQQQRRAIDYYSNHFSLLSLLLFQKGQVLKLCDFGSAFLQSEGHTTSNPISSSWMAPEVLSGSSDRDEKSDVYSWAICVWEMYSRQHPFGDVTNSNSIYWMLLEGVRPHHVAGIPPEINKLINRSWATEPILRPCTTEIVFIMLDVIHDLPDTSVPLHCIKKSVETIDTFQHRGSLTSLLSLFGWLSYVPSEEFEDTAQEMDEVDDM
ncbi:E3 ubiquitin-protein ligase MARCH5 [Trichinella patagoniensis]|uniref:E3 ubiquitin-protein ligase MARCHF5 n=1 Tax=Trichinella patagoniensis TaxID=990121 RepID=A0A0V0ZNY1_9BILA|nr:E3 ubiquitin-protein ligase MARCH5 [Trichinella patagoniensis]